MTRLASTNKDGVLAELVDLLVSNEALPSSLRDVVLTALRERETKMSTGMELGVAIPHAKIGEISNMVAGIALASDGVPFESLDKLPARIFVVIISPKYEIGTHVRFLGDISHILASDARRKALLDSTSSEEMLKALFD